MSSLVGLTSFWIGCHADPPELAQLFGDDIAAGDAPASHRRLRPDPKCAILNGIVYKTGVLIVAQSSTGKLFRVDPGTGTAKEVDLGGVSLGSVDGLELVGHTLYAVRNSNVVTVVRLGARLATGTVLGDITDLGLDVSTTRTVAAGRLWVVNAPFGTGPTPDTKYWITQLPLRPTNG